MPNKSVVELDLQPALIIWRLTPGVPLRSAPGFMTYPLAELFYRILINITLLIVLLYYEL